MKGDSRAPIAPCSHAGGSAARIVACLCLLAGCAGPRPQLGAPLAAPTLALDPPRHRFAWGDAGLCALRSPGELVCWKGRSGGDRMRVHGAFRDFVEVAVGDAHLCALRAGGEVYCLGDNDEHQLGDPTFALQHSEELRRVPGLPRAVRLVASGDATCVVTDEGEVYCFGETYEVVPGMRRVDQPTLVPELRGVTQLSLDANLACAVRRDGTVRCWGGTPQQRIADELPGITDAVEVASSGIVRCVRRRSGAVACSRHSAATQGMAIPADARWALASTDIKALAADWGTVCGQRRSGAIECTGWDSSERVKPDWLSDLDDSDAFVLGQTGFGCGIDAGGGVRVQSKAEGFCGETQLVEDGAGRNPSEGGGYGYSAEFSPLLRLGPSWLSGARRITQARFEGGLHLPLTFGTTVRLGPFVDLQTRGFSTFEPAGGLSLAASFGPLGVALDGGVGHVFGGDVARNFAMGGLRIGGGFYLDGASCRSGCGLRYFASAGLELQVRRGIGQDGLNDVGGFVSFDPLVLALPFAILLTDWHFR